MKIWCHCHLGAATHQVALLVVTEASSTPLHTSHFICYSTSCLVLLRGLPLVCDSMNIQWNTQDFCQIMFRCTGYQASCDNEEGLALPLLALVQFTIFYIPCHKVEPINLLVNCVNRKCHNLCLEFLCPNSSSEVD